MLFSSSVACVELIQELSVQVSDQRGTCLVEKRANAGSCL